jgi:hypothetical protein
VLYFEASAPKTAEALNTPEPANSDGIFYPTWLARKTMGKQFDPKTKGSTLKKYNPPAAYSQDVFKHFLTQQDRLLEMVEQAARADLQAKCWLIKWLPIRSNLGEFLNFFVAHDEFHINQAQRVLAAYRNWLENGMFLRAGLKVELVK